MSTGQPKTQRSKYKAADSKQQAAADRFPEQAGGSLSNYTGLQPRPTRSEERWSRAHKDSGVPRAP